MRCVKPSSTSGSFLQADPPPYSAILGGVKKVAVLEPEVRFGAQNKEHLVEERDLAKFVQVLDEERVRRAHVCADGADGVFGAAWTRCVRA